MPINISEEPDMRVICWSKAKIALFILRTLAESKGITEALFMTLSKWPLKLAPDSAARFPSVVESEKP